MNIYQNVHRACTFALLLLIAHLAGAQELLKVADWDKSAGFIQMKADAKVEPLTFFAKYGKDLGLGEHDEMVLLREEKDNLGMVHYRFQQKHKGIEVEYAKMIVHAKGGYVVSVSGGIEVDIRTNATFLFSEKDALDAAKSYLGNKQYLWENKEVIVPDTTKGEAHTFNQEKPVAKKKFIRKDDKVLLAYTFDMYFKEKGQAMNGYTVYIDGNTKQGIQSLPLVHNCSGQTTYTDYYYYNTKAAYSRTIYTQYQSWCTYPCPWPFSGCCGYNNYRYNLIDDCQTTQFRTYESNINSTTGYIPNNGTNNSGSWNSGKQYLTMPHWAVKRTYNYFGSNFGLYGTGNPYSNIIEIWAEQGYHDSFSASNSANNPNNDFLMFGWDIGCLLGPSCEFHSGNLDIAGHEYTHRITAHSSGLYYWGQPMASNESFSDIFGAMAEFSEFGTNGNYQIGEYVRNSIYPPFRDMSNPNLYGQPDTYLGTYWDASGDPHINSGVQNYWFYLLAEGGSGTNDLGNTYCVQGIGKAAAANIAYQTLRFYISTPNAQFVDVRNSSMQAAIAIYGANSNELQQVFKAWYAVGVGADPISLTTNTPYVCPISAPATLSGIITTGTAPYTVTLYNNTGAAPIPVVTLTNTYTFSVSPTVVTDYYVIATDVTGMAIYMGGCPVRIEIFNNNAISIDAYSGGATSCNDDNIVFMANASGTFSNLTWNVSGQIYNDSLLFSIPLQTGVYPTTLNITTTNGCTATASNNVVVNPYFCGNPAFSPAVNGNLISLNAVDNVAMADWQVYDNNTGGYIGSYPLDSTSLHLAGGDYIIYHVMYDCDSNFCDYTYQYVSTCDPLQVSIIGNNPICAGTSTTYTANVTGGNGGYTYSWNVAGQIGNSITISPTVNKNYTVYVTAPKACATVSASINVIVNPLPVVTITGPTSFCTGGTAFLTANCSTAVSYQWYKTGTSNLIVGATNSTYIPTVSGNYYVKVTDANGCTKQAANYNVTVNASPPANAGADKTICAGSKTKIGVVGNAAYTYTWSPTNGLATPLKDTSSCITSVNRTYVLTVTNPNTGCSRKDTMYVMVNPLPAIPVITLNGINPTCAGAGTTLSTLSGMASYQWNWGGNNINGATNNIYSPASSGNHRVIVTDINGCSRGSLNYNIIVNPAPPANAGADKTICAGSPVSIGTTNNNAYTYSWSPGLGLSDSLISNPQAFPMDTTQYVLTVTNNNNFCSKKDTMKVITKPLPPTPMLVITTPALPGEDSIIFCEGATNVVLAGTAPGFSNFYWYKNGTYYGAGATSMVSNQALSATGDNFTIKTKGANSCYSIASNPIFVQKLAAPQPIISPAGINNVVMLCGYGTNIGKDTLTASVPANAPSVYSYEWQNAVSGVYVPATNAFSFPLNDSLPVSVTGTQIKYYRVVATYENTCQRTSVVKRLEKSTNCKESIGKNGDEVIIEVVANKMNVFPNPTQDILYIELKGEALDKGVLSLINTLGQVIITKEIHFEQDNIQLEWNLSALAAGVYSLSFSTKNGQEVMKIVKE